MRHAAIDDKKYKNQFVAMIVLNVIVLSTILYFDVDVDDDDSDDAISVNDEPIHADGNGNGNGNEFIIIMPNRLSIKTNRSTLF